MFVIFFGIAFIPITSFNTNLNQLNDPLSGLYSMHVMHTILYSIQLITSPYVLIHIILLLISEMIVSNDDDDKNYTFFEGVLIHTGVEL